MEIIQLTSKLVGTLKLIKNFLMSKQEQKSGDGSANIQVAGDVVVGLSVNEVRQLALDVFKANFYDLGGVGKQIVVTRVEEITDAIIKKLQ